MNRALNQIKFKDKVQGFILDGDNKNSKLLQECNFNTFVFRDPNHLGLGFNRYLDSKLSENKKMRVGISDCFRRIYSPLEEEAKRNAWLNTVSHLLGFQQNCLYY